MNYDFFVKKKSVQEQLKHLYENHTEEFNKFFSSTQKDKITHSNLEKYFIDSDGKQYYRFPKTMDLPLMRKAELAGYYMFLASGVSGKEYEDILNTEDAILTEGIGKPETAAKLGALMQIKRKRLKMVVHSELYLNITAIQAIREDEEPSEFNNQLHHEKVKQFKKEIELKNPYFFFQEIQLQSPIDLSRLSQVELVSLWNESELEIQALPEILKLLREFTRVSTRKEKFTNTKKTSPAS